MKMSRRVYSGAAVAAAVALVLGAGDAGAYSTFSAAQGPPPTGNCVTCHGDFRADPYLPPSGSMSWGTDLMDGHERVIIGGFQNACNVCHGAAAFYPVSTFSSAGVGGQFTSSCLGCHGRTEPGLGMQAAGLRQHHWRDGVTLCSGCHPDDSNPGVYMPVGEDVLPANYDLNLAQVTETDPCNPGGMGEDFAGDSAGLDNDGDDIYDGLDPDCMAATPTPTPTPTPPAGPTPTPPAGPTPTPTPPAGPTPTPPVTPTPTASPTPGPTATPSPTPVATPTPAPTPPPGPAGTIVMCTEPRGPLGAQRNLVVRPERAARLIAKGRATPGECAFPANGPIMCGVRRGQLVQRAVPVLRVTTMQGKGWMLGPCDGMVPMAAR